LRVAEVQGRKKTGNLIEYPFVVEQMLEDDKALLNFGDDFEWDIYGQNLFVAKDGTTKIARMTKGQDKSSKGQSNKTGLRIVSMRKDGEWCFVGHRLYSGDTLTFNSNFCIKDEETEETTKTTHTNKTKTLNSDKQNKKSGTSSGNETNKTTQRSKNTKNDNKTAKNTKTTETTKNTKTTKGKKKTDTKIPSKVTPADILGQIPNIPNFTAVVPMIPKVTAPGVPMIPKIKSPDTLKKQKVTSTDVKEKFEIEDNANNIEDNLSTKETDTQ
jgi:hypothetical protein